MALTNTQVKHAKPSDTPYKLADGGGMYLLVAVSGGRYWRLKYRFGGKEKLLALGTYPDVSLLDARKAREAAREVLRAGADPGRLKEEKKALDLLNQAQTFEVVARQWHMVKRDSWEEATARDKLYRLEKDVFPHIGALPIASLNPRDILTVLRKVESRGGARTDAPLETNHRPSVSLRRCRRASRE